MWQTKKQSQAPLPCSLSGLEIDCAYSSSAWAHMGRASERFFTQAKSVFDAHCHNHDSSNPYDTQDIQSGVLEIFFLIYLFVVICVQPPKHKTKL